MCLYVTPIIVVHFMVVSVSGSPILVRFSVSRIIITFGFTLHFFSNRRENVSF